MASDPLVGQVLHDTHEEIRLIGKGGMGIPCLRKNMERTE